MGVCSMHKTSVLKLLIPFWLICQPVHQVTMYALIPEINSGLQCTACRATWLLLPPLYIIAGASTGHYPNIYSINTSALPQYSCESHKSHQQFAATVICKRLYIVAINPVTTVFNHYRYSGNANFSPRKKSALPPTTPTRINMATRRMMPAMHKDDDCLSA